MALASKGLINALPSDPVGGHALFSTGYMIMRAPSGIVNISAPRAENGAVISETVN